MVSNGELSNIKRMEDHENNCDEWQKISFPGEEKTFYNSCQDLEDPPGDRGVFVIVNNQQQEQKNECRRFM